MVGLTPGAAELGKTVQGPHSDPLAVAARDNGVYVIAGLREVDGANVYGLTVVISSEGKPLMKYRKVNLPPNDQGIHRSVTGYRRCIPGTAG